MTLDKEQVLEILRAHETELHRRGVRHAALFGSVARGEADEKSDIDILIELEPDSKRTLFGYAGLKRAVAALFPGPVDVIDKRRLKPGLLEPVETEVVYAF